MWVSREDSRQRSNTCKGPESLMDGRISRGQHDSGKETGSRERAGPAQPSHAPGPTCFRLLPAAPGAHRLFLSYFCASADRDAGERPFYQLVS